LLYAYFGKYTSKKTESEYESVACRSSPVMYSGLYKQEHVIGFCNVRNSEKEKAKLSQPQKSMCSSVSRVRVC